MCLPPPILADLSIRQRFLILSGHRKPKDSSPLFLPPITIPLNTAHFLPSPLPSLPPIPCPLFSNSFPCHTSKNSPVSPALAPLPKLAFITPVFATHPRAPQGVPTPNVPAFNLSAFQRYLTYPLFFHTLAHYFALTKISTRLFSSASALLAKNHPGGRGRLAD